MNIRRDARMIVMDAQTQLKVDIIAKVFQGKISIRNASKLLNKSRRTIERYLSSYNKEGLTFAIHKNKNRNPINKSSEKLKVKVQELIKKKYFDFNLTHLAEMLSKKENLNIKRETLRTWAHEIHHVKRAKKRRQKIRKKRERMGSPGLLLQLDGSPHRWFGNKKSCLMAIIDDANSEIHAEFFEAETTFACMKLLREVINKKGLFKALYVDRAGLYGGPKRCHFSQVKRACEELGIEIIFANSAEAKGRVERSFDTLQDRLIPELRVNKINDFKGANDYLKNQFIPNYWEKEIMIESQDNNSEYSKLPSHLNLDNILIQKEYRKIRNDHTFSFANTFYLIESDLKYSIAKQEIEIHLYPGNKFKAFFGGKELFISEIIEPTKPGLFEPEIQKKIDAIELSEKLNNVSEAARISGVSRQTIYKNKKLLKEKGALALKRTFDSNRRHKNRISEKLEEQIIEFSLKNPHLGQAQVSSHFKTKFNASISPAGVRNIWLRHDMQTMAKRLERKEEAALKMAA